jgi:hypothetical protein
LTLTLPDTEDPSDDTPKTFRDQFKGKKLAVFDWVVSNWDGALPSIKDIMDATEVSRNTVKPVWDILNENPEGFQSSLAQ